MKKFWIQGPDPQEPPINVIVEVTDETNFDDLKEAIGKERKERDYPACPILTIFSRNQDGDIGELFLPEDLILNKVMGVSKLHFTSISETNGT